jgi:hypothetical protein
MVAQGILESRCAEYKSFCDSIYNNDHIYVFGISVIHGRKG